MIALGIGLLIVGFFLVRALLRQRDWEEDEIYASRSQPWMSNGRLVQDCPGMCGWSHEYEVGICDREDEKMTEPKNVEEAAPRNKRVNEAIERFRVEACGGTLRGYADSMLRDLFYEVLNADQVDSAIVADMKACMKDAEARAKQAGEDRDDFKRKMEHEHIVAELALKRATEAEALAQRVVDLQTEQVDQNMRLLAQREEWKAKARNLEFTADVLPQRVAELEAECEALQFVVALVLRLERERIDTGSNRVNSKMWEALVSATAGLAKTPGTQEEIPK